VRHCIQARAVVLLGKDEVIKSILPHYRTDALVRIKDTDRHDDRDDIRTNLIEAYDRLMAFIDKWLPDKFYQDENGNSIDLRNRIFREVVANLLVHREFINAFPVKLVISKNAVETENWSKAHGNGIIDPINFSPFPKNPNITKFFKEIGRVDELGSGVRNVHRFCGLYTPGKSPEFLEGDVFKTRVPVDGTTDGTIEGTIEGATNAVKKRLKVLLHAIVDDEGKRIPDYTEITQIKAKTLERYIKQLRDIDLIGEYSEKCVKLKMNQLI